MEGFECAYCKGYCQLPVYETEQRAWLFCGGALAETCTSTQAVHMHTVSGHISKQKVE